jgi:hypothetical protein
MTSDSEPSRQNGPTINADQEAERQANSSDEQILSATAKPEMPPANCPCCGPHKGKKHWIDYATVILEIVGLVVLCVYAGYTIKIYCANKKAADAAKSAADTARQALEVSNRPWVKIDHRIIQPLTFNVTGIGASPTATIAFEETLENVGPSVALNVLKWEQIVPLDADGGVKSAETIQKERCDSNRHPQSRLVDFTLFPRDPKVEQDAVGLVMSKVNDASAHSMLKGKVAFVLVGCVYYRTPLESLDSPRHETTFFYWLESPMGNGLEMPYVSPSGVASRLRLQMATESAD